MSVPPIRITESRSYVTHRSSKISVAPPAPQELPSSALVTFDLEFGNLTEYLNSVSSVVNSHGQLLRKLIDDLNTRVSVSDMLEVFGALGSSVSEELGEVQLRPSGDDWHDRASLAVSKLEVLSLNSLSTNQFRSSVTQRIDELENQLKNRPTKAEVAQNIKTAQDETFKALRDTENRLERQIQDFNAKLNERMVELERKFITLEQNTLWKMKDIEELLKHRVSEKYVEDAISHLEEALSKKVEHLTEIGVAKHGKALQELLKDLRRLEQDSSAKLKTLKEETIDLDSRLNRKVDPEAVSQLSRDFDKLRESIRDMRLGELKDELRTLNFTSDQHSEQISLLIQHSKSTELQDQIEFLKSFLDSLRADIESKLDKDVAIELLNKANEPSRTQIQERNDMLEFWKFRERSLEQFKTIEHKLERLNRVAEINALKKAVKHKADHATVTGELENHTHKIGGIEKFVGQTAKDIEQLQAMFRKLQALIQEMSARSGFALVSRKNMAPSNCLSCGRGDAKFAPVMPHVMGVDGKLYKAEGALAKPAVIEFDDDFEIKSEVLSVEDPHRQSGKGPLNVILGKAWQKQPRYRPMSAKK